MSLNQQQKETLRKIQLYCYSSQEKNGKPILNDVPFEMLDFPEIFEQAKSEILSNKEFISVERTAPHKANCIIRVFSTKHYHYDDQLVYNIYGASCYTRLNMQWQTSPEFQGNFVISYKKHITRSWLCQDEYIDFDHNFVDYYVKVSPRS